MSRFVLNRRQLLRGAGGVAIGLPFLEAMNARADILPFPKRFVVFFTPEAPHNGGDCDDAGACSYSPWLNSGTEHQFTLSPVLAPLTDHQSKLIVVQGVDLESSYHGLQDNGHPESMAHLLSGTECIAADNSVGFTGGGISVDQEIANQIGGSTKLRSLELGVQTELYHAPFNRLSYTGPGEAIPPENDPSAAFDRVFGDFESADADPFALAKLRARRRSVLDAVASDLTDLNGKLGLDDRAKLDAHLTAVRELEKRLDATTSTSPACQVPSAPAPLDPQAPENFPEVGKLHMDILVMALACDLTRVGSLLWSYTGSEVVHSWLGITETHHTELAHGPDSIAKQQDIHTWYNERFAYFLNALQAIPEGDEWLLDHMVILRCNDLAHGHTRRNMPFVLAGGCNSHFATGRLLTYNGVPHNNLLVSLLNAMDIDANTFGDAAYCTGPLSGLT